MENIFYLSEFAMNDVLNSLEILLFTYILTMIDVYKNISNNNSDENVMAIFKNHWLYIWMRLIETYC